MQTQLLGKRKLTIKMSKARLEGPNLTHVHVHVIVTTRKPEAIEVIAMPCEEVGILSVTSQVDLIRTERRATLSGTNGK